MLNWVVPILVKRGVVLHQVVAQFDKGGVSVLLWMLPILISRGACFALLI